MSASEDPSGSPFPIDDAGNFDWRSTGDPSDGDMRTETSVPTLSGG
ncbi:hypothetical protein NJ7G_1228 [Natrinema sp. J7-2]|nr:hypothetical protein NJ7G_1228 [Natrinema sp. J7-2]